MCTYISQTFSIRATPGYSQTTRQVCAAVQPIVQDENTAGGTNNLMIWPCNQLESGRASLQRVTLPAVSDPDILLVFFHALTSLFLILYFKNNWVG